MKAAHGGRRLGWCWLRLNVPKKRKRERENVVDEAATL